MPQLSAIQARLAEVEHAQNAPLITAILEQLSAQHYCARFSADWVAKTCAQFQLTPVELALQCLPLAACYALTPISHFFVGAVAIGQSGAFYFGANQEYAHIAIAQTVHAEQSAVAHAWQCGENGVSDMVVNYTPCGHCRQFLNETVGAKQLRIHLPHSQHRLLHHYLPDDFSPTHLGVEKVLLEAQEHGLSIESDDLLIQAAVRAANTAYAPYSQAASGVALQVGSHIITGRYAENAAFNPSFLPLQNALNLRRLSGLADEPILRAVLAEKKAVLSHRTATKDLLTTFGVALEVVILPE